MIRSSNFSLDAAFNYVYSPSGNSFTLANHWVCFYVIKKEKCNE